MKQEIYDNIIEDVKDFPCFEKAKHIEFLISKYSNISYDTFVSIYAQYTQRKVKKSFHRHHKPENISKYFRNYMKSVMKSEKPGFLYRLAKEIDYPPTLLARTILEECFKEKNDSDSVPKDIISKLLKNYREIENKTLSQEIEICVNQDENYGPIIENIKKEVGLKYERMLHDILLEHQIHYYDEENLREEGYDKTPDFKLVVPIAVDCHVVNWIESKALFGDSVSHSGYLEKQFWSYTNRFGPGLVIYWFGFIDELNVNVDQGIMLNDNFPKEYTKLNQLLDQHEKDFLLVF